jgi:hypothetical protein
VLAGWAQLRHTWALQAKQTVHYAGIAMVPKGFVEPEPEFFARMATLSDSTRRLLKGMGAFRPDYSHILAGLETLGAVLDGVETEEELREKFRKLTQDDRVRLQLPYMLMETAPSKAEFGSKDYFIETRAWLEKIAADIGDGKLHEYPQLEAVVREFEFDLEELWDRLGEISRRLEVIAHKQLRGVDLSKSENSFVEAYGSKLAGIMLYGGNSYLTPRDDAPRAVDVYSNPRAGGYLHVGIARPRKLYVLYPWKGKTLLCEGAVMPYSEFVAEARLTDQSWKERLDSEKRPPVPRWMKPIVSDGDLGVPVLRDE